MATQTTIASNIRQRHTELPSLRIVQVRRASLHSSIRQPSVTLPSPSLAVAREWYREHASTDEMQGIISDDPPTTQFPRRHSVMPTPASLTAQLEGIKLSSPTMPPATLPEEDETQSTFQVEEVNDNSSPDPKQSDLTNLRHIANPSLPSSSQSDDPTRRHSDPNNTLSTLLRQVPFQYTHDHLHSWGPAYFLNLSTCDALVNAVNLRRPSLFLQNGEDDFENPAGGDKTTIRARVLPCEKGRKPFIIQRQFDVGELRRAVPKCRRVATDVEGTDTRMKDRKEERYALRSRRASAQAGRSGTAAASQSRGRPVLRTHTSSGSGAIPIHIEYALHYLPVLAALMLSGHVRRRDAIDLPMPHPGAWHDVVAFAYTGRGEVTKAMKDNIYFLGGNL